MVASPRKPHHHPHYADMVTQVVEEADEVREERGREGEGGARFPFTPCPSLPLPQMHLTARQIYQEVGTAWGPALGAQWKGGVKKAMHDAIESGALLRPSGVGGGKIYHPDSPALTEAGKEKAHGKGTPRAATPKARGGVRKKATPATKKRGSRAAETESGSGEEAPRKKAATKKKGGRA